MDDILKKIRDARREVVLVGVSQLFQSPESWNEFTKKVLPELEASDVKLEVLAESDNQLFQLSLGLDDKSTSESNRISFSELKIRRGLVFRECTKTEDRRVQWKFGISSVIIGFSGIKIDDEIYILPLHNPMLGYSHHKLLKPSDIWYQEISSFITGMRSSDGQGRYVAQHGEEMLELFDKDGIPRGIFPRGSFYDSDHAQFVVWGFIFDREGRMLIHQRSETAKDNQGMWDKSVGGHVDFTLERSSNFAAVRELVEELFTDEKPAKDDEDDTYSGLEFLKPSFQNSRYLGDWNPGSLGTDYFTQIALEEEDSTEGKEPWFYYQVANDLEVNSPRLIPEKKGGGQKRLKVISDVYVFLAAPKLNQRSLRQLKNSKYILCYPSELRTWLEAGERDGEPFKGTPDLNYVMTGKLRDTLEEASQITRYAGIKK